MIVLENEFQAIALSKPIVPGIFEEGEKSKSMGTGDAY